MIEMDDLYESRRLTIHARQWTALEAAPGEYADVLRERAQAIVAWVKKNGGEAEFEPASAAQYGGATLSDRPARIIVQTNSGPAPVAPGWWIMQGTERFHVDGRPTGAGCRDVLDHYPCDPATFEKRWQKT